MTKSGTHPTGGQASLSLDNHEAPFAGGVKFTAMPPSKRYCEMDQLSGGEKTVAALALLFAIHRCGGFRVGIKGPVSTSREARWLCVSHEHFRLNIVGYVFVQIDRPRI